MSIEYHDGPDGTTAVIRYTMDDGLQDGTFVLLGDMGRFDDQRRDLQPLRLVVTRTVHDFLGAAGTQDVVQAYCRWYNTVRLTLPADERTFEVQRQGKRLWLVEHPEGFTLMFPEEY